MCIDEKFVDEKFVDGLLEEYFIYLKDKHDLPFVIWLKCKKGFDYNTIHKIYAYLEN